MPPPERPPVPAASGPATGTNILDTSSVLSALLRPSRLVARAPVGDPSPSQVRKLVLDYLCHECFVDSAIALAKDERRVDAADARGTTNPGGEAAASKGGEKPQDYLGAVLAGVLGTEGVKGERSVRFDTADDEIMGDATAAEMEVDPKPASALSNGSSSKAVNGHDAGLARQGYPELSAQDIHRTRWRLEIREHIVAGRIKEAIAALESHFPSVLDNAVVPPPSAPEPTTSGPAVKTIFGDNPARTGSRTAISTPSSTTTLLRPLSGPNPRSPLLRATSAGTNGKPSPAGTISDRPHAMFASLEPSHIALNLQTQAFIEFVRSAGFPASSSSRPDDAPAASSSSPKRVLTDLANSTGSLEGGDGSPAGSMISSASSAVSQKTAHLALSLSYCQALWRRAGELPEPSERIVFLKELESVSALLSYPDPWASPARRYMEQSRRDGLAERVNAAILVSLGRPPTPVLQLAAQQTTFMWNTLHDFDVKLTALIANRTAVRPLPDKVCPPFMLSWFVDEPVVADDSPKHGLQALLR